MNATAVAADFAARRAALRADLAAQNLDALLVSNLLNIRYLTGFTGSNAALLVHVNGDDESVFCTDGRYVTQAAAQVPDLRTMVERAAAIGLAKTAAGRVGFEASDVTVASHQALTGVASAELVETSGLVEGLRAVKDDHEIELLRIACRHGDQAFADLIERGSIRPGRTERQVGLELDQRMRELGAEDPAFETIVAAGPNSAIPHHRPTDAVLQPGDLVKFDFGARHGGYHSDMTRTVVLGEPAQWQREIFDLVLAAQSAAEALVRPGVPTADLDDAARKLIAEGGHADHFVHGLGHGVGLEIHEAPAVGAGSAGTLAANMVVTVEPGIYLEGRGGVRIEDSGVVRPSGYEVLTLTTKNLLVL